VRDDKITKEEVLHKAEAKCSAIQQRINLTQKYLHLLNDISKSLSDKSKRYDEANKEGNKILQ